MTASSPSAPHLEGLPLAAPTSPEWFAVAAGDVDALLVDHAHCEQKAASASLGLLGRYPEDPAAVRTLLAVAYEELRHFREVAALLEKRGVPLVPPRPDRYVRALRDWSFKSPGGVGARADAFLAAAFVEARSCERFRILAAGFAGDAAPGPSADAAMLAGFYGRLADAERRHWETFRDLARAAADPGAVDRRAKEMAAAEADIVRGLPLEPLMH